MTRVRASVCLLSICVAGGLASALTTTPIRNIDRYSAQHLMPGRPSIPAYLQITPAGKPEVALLEPHPGLARKAHYVWGPFSRLFATVLVLAFCTYAVVRRREKARPIGWLAGFGLANLAAFVMQDRLRRPDLVFHTASNFRYSVDAYAASFPSGYSVRVVFAALVACALWRRAILIAAPVTLAVLVAIVGGGSHLLTDMIAGVAIATGSYLLGDGAATRLASALANRPLLRAHEVERPAPDDEPGKGKDEYQPDAVRDDRESPHRPHGNPGGESCP